MTGGHYDIIGVDPRGTGVTLPIDCNPDQIEHIRTALSIPEYTNNSDTALGTAWAYFQVYAEQCYKNAGEIGELVGTGFVARDLMQIVDALGEDGMLRYWGELFILKFAITI